MQQNKDAQIDDNRKDKNTLISIIVPVYNEEKVIPIFHVRIENVLETIPEKSEIIYVNDGSTDNTLKIIKSFKTKNKYVAIVDLSRNFGKEIALTAGIDHAKGDTVIVIDADLQDPPELIPELLKYRKEGYDVVYAKRVSRLGEGVIKRGTAHVFYRVMNTLSKVKVPEDTGDFRAMSRRAVDSLKELREHHRFMKGLFSWIGYQQKGIPYKRDARYAGKTKWNYWKLWNFALEGITSFTTAPLLTASYLGIITSLTAFIYAVYIVYKTLVYGDPVRGYPSLMVVILFLGGIQLLSIGVIGEYIGRIFNETKRRPLYILKDFIPSDQCDTNIRGTKP
jgi:glycosyltransferase involved in cell wall biosynthesis